MTNSSMSLSPPQSAKAPAKASGEHWYDLTATLSRHAREDFGNWLDGELRTLESELSDYSTAGSRQKVQFQRQGFRVVFLVSTGTQRSNTHCVKPSNYLDLR
jgi:hypothetical protein